MAEAEDLKSSQCGFDPHSGHRYRENSEKNTDWAVAKPTQSA